MPVAVSSLTVGSFSVLIRNSVQSLMAMDSYVILKFNNYRRAQDDNFVIAGPMRSGQQMNLFIASCRI